MPRLSKKEVIEVQFEDATLKLSPLIDSELLQLRGKTQESFLELADDGKIRELTRTYTIEERESFVDSIVLGWKGFCDEEGKEMECTSENKKRWACYNNLFNFLKKFQKDYINTANGKEENTEKK